MEAFKPDIMKYTIKNLHSVARSYRGENGQQIRFGPGEQKTLKSKPPRDEGLWQVEAVEETAKPEDTEIKGGEN